MLSPIGAFVDALVKSAEASVVLPVIGLALMVGGLTWAWANHEHGKAKVTAGLIGGAIAIMGPALATSLATGIPH